VNPITCNSKPESSVVAISAERPSTLKHIDLIAGARPNFMKIAPIIDALKAAEASGGALRYRLIHTGQHYDQAMSGGFFEQLSIPEPDINLEVGSGTQAEQAAAIMVRYERVLLEQRSDLCLVVGDVTSTMACSIAARKCGVPVAHVEGWHSFRRLVNAGGNQSCGDGLDHQLVLHYQRGGQCELAPLRGNGRSHFLRWKHDDRYAAETYAAFSAARVLE
jgi:hypothetical protein